MEEATSVITLKIKAMPEFDKTGPEGEGPMTGRRLGRCTGFGSGKKKAESTERSSEENQAIRGRGPGLGRRGTGRGMGRGPGRGMGGGSRYRGGNS